MIICMSDIICVTNRTLCKRDFLQQITEIAAAKPQSIILREKDLSEDAYAALAREVTAVCQAYDIPCTLHNFVQTAIPLGAERIHLPMPVLRTLTAAEKAAFSVIGASVHAPEEAAEAEMLGAAYLTAGHIFTTDCKKGLPGRGLDFLSAVCRSVRIPVYAIGGISPGNIAEIRHTGAAGACVMSGLMQCGNVKTYLKQFEMNSERESQDHIP